MVGHRRRATRPAVALWVLVLLADSAAAGTLTELAYALAGAVLLAFALVQVRAVAARREGLGPRPVRVRATYHPYGRR